MYRGIVRMIDFTSGYTPILVKYKPWYSKYLHDGTHDNYLEPHNIIRNNLNYNKPRECPHCGSNHRSMQIEGYDYYCFICGWRESELFNGRLNNFLKFIERLENKNGKPRLRSSLESQKLINHRNDYNKHRLERIEHTKIYNLTHKEHRKEYKHQYYLDNKERINMLAKEWAKNHPEIIKEKRKERHSNNLESERKYKRDWARLNRAKQKELQEA